MHQETTFVTQEPCDSYLPLQLHKSVQDARNPTVCKCRSKTFIGDISVQINVGEAVIMVKHCPVQHQHVADLQYIVY